MINDISKTTSKYNVCARYSIPPYILVLLEAPECLFRITVHV